MLIAPLSSEFLCLSLKRKCFSCSRDVNVGGEVMMMCIMCVHFQFPTEIDSDGD